MFLLYRRYHMQAYLRMGCRLMAFRSYFCWRFLTVPLISYNYFFRYAPLPTTMYYFLTHTYKHHIHKRVHATLGTSIIFKQKETKLFGTCNCHLISTRISTKRMHCGYNKRCLIATPSHHMLRPPMSQQNRGARFQLRNNPNNSPLPV